MQQGRRRGIRVSMEHSSGNLVSKYPSTTVVHRKCYQQPECLPYSKYDANGRHLPSCYAIDIECHLDGWLAGLLFRSLARCMDGARNGWAPLLPSPSLSAGITDHRSWSARSVGRWHESFGVWVVGGVPLFCRLHRVVMER